MEKLQRGKGQTNQGGIETVSPADLSVGTNFGEGALRARKTDFLAMGIVGIEMADSLGNVDGVAQLRNDQES